MTRPLPQTLNFAGVVLDLEQANLPPTVWSDGRNVFFKAGETLRVAGEAPFAPAELFDVDVHHYVDIGPQSWWIYAGATTGGRIGIGTTDGAQHFDITPALWGNITTKNLILTIGDLNGLPFVNHPERGPFWWDGDPSHIMTPLPDWPANWAARVMRAHKEFLMAINIDTGVGLLEGQVSWSSSADPGQVPEFWVPAPENDAGDMTFASPGGPLVDGITLRDQFFVAKSNAIWAMQYVGGQFVFGKRDVYPSIGLYSPNAWVEHGNLCYMLTGGLEFVRHDGASEPSNLLYGVMQDYIRKAINAEFPSSVFCYRNATAGQIMLAYPAGSGRACTEAINIEAASGAACVRDLPRVFGIDAGLTGIIQTDWDSDLQAWDEDTTTWNENPSGYQPTQLVYAGGTQGMLQVGASDDFWGENQAPLPVSAYVTREGVDMNEWEFRKAISGAWPRIKGHTGNTLYFRFGGKDQVGQSTEWEDELPLVIGTDFQLDFFVDARLLSFSLRSDGGAPWKFSGYRTNARKSGKA